ncbi:MAG: hypothetical protein QOC73_2477, partial [Actinomycetota bacterium]|nr:hypothetical protein [Actinomycetota bacterium]
MTAGLPTSPSRAEVIDQLVAARIA